MNTISKMNAEVFLKVAELGSYRKAAEELGYTQAGITYIINAIEKETGLLLFDRYYGEVKLTQNGRELLPWVKELFNCECALSERVSELRTLHAGKIRVMCFNRILVYWLPEIIERFHNQYPDIAVELIACDRLDEIEKALYRREVDCGFLRLPSNADLETLTLSEEPMLVAFSPDHPLSAQKRISFSALEQYPYIGPPLEYDPGIRGFFEKNGITPKIGLTTENDDASLALASRGLGYCIYPRFMLEQSPFPLVSAEPEKPLRWKFGIGIKELSTCSAAAKAFIEMCRRE